MNVFGTFTFGNLIKTFLPGFLWLIVIIFIESLFAEYSGRHNLYSLFTSSKNHTSANSIPQSALLLSIPIAILFGLISNIIVFMFVNDWLVRKPFADKYPDLKALHDQFCNRIISNKAHLIGFENEIHKKQFLNEVDSEIIILADYDLPKFAYIREQYWYYLEFQMNMLLATISLLVVLFLYFCQINVGFGWHFTNFVTLIPLCILLLYSARKNYMRHITKMVSLYASTIIEQEKEMATEQEISSVTKTSKKLKDNK